jgi:hypothetical protein
MKCWCDKCQKEITYNELFQEWNSVYVTNGLVSDDEAPDSWGEFCKLADGEYCHDCVREAMVITQTHMLAKNTHETIERLLTCQCDKHTRLRADGKLLLLLFDGYYPLLRNTDWKKIRQALS